MISGQPVSYTHGLMIFQHELYCLCSILAQFLDLSYNSVSEMAVLTLGNLPLLRELHLTGHYTHHTPDLYTCMELLTITDD